MEEILKNISSKDLEKLKMLLSIIPQTEPKEVITLRVFRDEYLNFIQSNRSKSYYISVKLAFNHMIEFFGIQYPVHTLMQKQIENFMIDLQQKVKKGYVVYFRNLKAAFNKAKDWDYVKENYFIKVKLPKRQKSAPTFINSEQLSEICEQIKNKTARDFVSFAFHTGMRLDEIVNLRWKNIDLHNRVIIVGDESFVTKGRNQRFIPICEEALDSLLRTKSVESTKQTVDKCRVQNMNPLCPLDISPLEKGGEYLNAFVFCKENGEKFTGNYFSKKFKNACKAAGLNNAIHFHSLRHSFASNLVQKGVPLYTVKELLGHSSISTTEIYSHLNMDALREAVKKLDTGYRMLDAGGPHPDPLPAKAGQALGKEREKSSLKIFRINSMEK